MINGNNLHVYMPNATTGHRVQEWHPLDHDVVSEIYQIANQTKTEIQPYVGFRITGSDTGKQGAYNALEDLYLKRRGLFGGEILRLDTQA